jgi:hypothetical protein
MDGGNISETHKRDEVAGLGGEFVSQLLVVRN